jgi:predicted kinase
VRERHEAGRDASEADLRVLEHQLQAAEPLTSDERAVTVAYDAQAPLERSRRVDAWRSVLERLHLEAPVAS